MPCLLCILLMLLAHLKSPEVIWGVTRCLFFSWRYLLSSWHSLFQQFIMFKKEPHCCYCSRQSTRSYPISCFIIIILIHYTARVKDTKSTVLKSVTQDQEVSWLCVEECTDESGGMSITDLMWLIVICDLNHIHV